MRAAQLSVDYTDQKTQIAFHQPVTIFKKPTNEKEYKKLERLLDSLIDQVGNDENHPLADVMEIIGDNLESYDDEHHPAIGNDVTNIEMIQFLIAKHNLHQKDLASIFGSQANVSKFLNGERELSKKQILGLKERFGISADFFLK